MLKETFPRLVESDGTRLLVESAKLFARYLDPNLVLGAFKKIVADTMDCDGLLVSSYNRPTGMIRCTYAWVDGEVLDTSVFPEVAFDPVPGRGMQSEVIRTGEPRLFEDVRERVEQGTGEYYQANEGEMEELPKGSRSKAQSAMMVPLKLDDDVVGVAQVMADHYGAYDERHLLFFEGLALQLAAALNNAQLFEEKQAEISNRILVEQALREADERVVELNATLEALVEERTAELRQTVSDLEGFCHSVSHDLRTPLRAISGSAMILIEDYSEHLPADAVENLLSMRGAAEKMSKLIDGLLKLSRVGRSPMRRKDLNLTRMAERIAREYGPGISFHIEPGMRANADPTMLEVVLGHLIDNSAKFRSTSSPARIDICSETRNGERVFCIRDNGIGFEQRYARKLFLPFERLHRDGSYPGTGVGLAMVKRIIDRHAGHVWIEGKLGQGSAVYFSLGDG